MAHGLVALAPNLPIGSEAANAFTLFAVELAELETDNNVDALRDAWLSRVSASASHGQQLRVCISVLADLKAQGWSLYLKEEGIFVQQPATGSADVLLQKKRVRKGHLRERDYQLSQPSVRQFIAEMERPRLRGHGWVSVFSLMRDGRELADKLRGAAAITDQETRLRLLRGCIDPYLQPVTTGTVCELTGLPLADIWRYFRHTWTNHYNSTPGRQVAFLVRDRAAKDHPVIGIGAYGSAVVQLSVRDEWIGWTSERFLERLRDESTRLGPWVLRALDELVAAIHIDDFLAERVLTKQLLRDPDVKVIQRLRRVALTARQRHRADPQVSEHKAASGSGTAWRREVKTSLFRFKRAAMLAKLLESRMALNAVGFVAKNATDTAVIFQSARAVQAVRTVLRHTKAAHVGVDMVDITVCGAIAPYGPILGGKLVALLLAGPGAVQEYERRYKGAVSVIASSMAGKPVVRPPKLVLLGTTSLYGMSSSQYNRLRVPAEVLGGESGHVIEYKELGHSTGFGSFHFSTRTTDEIEVLLSQQQDGRPVNSIFGEGVNPKLRKLRSGLEIVGFPADALLRHGDSRLVYGVALATNFRDVLLDLTKRRIPLVPKATTAKGSQLLADFWMQRWLAGRIDRTGVLESVASHTMMHPVTHGARVTLPEGTQADAAHLPLVEST